VSEKKIKSIFGGNLEEEDSTKDDAQLPLLATTKPASKQANRTGNDSSVSSHFHSSQTIPLISFNCYFIFQIAVT